MLTLGKFKSGGQTQENTVVFCLETCLEISDIANWQHRRTQVIIKIFYLLKKS